VSSHAASGVLIRAFFSAVLLLVACGGKSSLHGDGASPDVLRPTGDASGSAGTSVGGTAGGGTAGAAGPAGTNGAAGSAGGTIGQSAGTGGGGAGGSAAGATDGGAGTGVAGIGGGDDGGAAGTTDAAPPVTIKGHPEPGKVYPSYPGFTLDLVEEFNEPLDLNHDPIWTWGDGGQVGTLRYTEAAVSFANGMAVLTVTATPVPMSMSYSDNGIIGVRPKSGGELRTKYKNYRWGRYEISMRSPEGNPSNFMQEVFARHWSTIAGGREVGIQLMGSRPTDVRTYVTSRPPQTFGNERGAAVRLPAADFVVSAFHTYAIEALPTGVTFFIDGARVASVPANTAPGNPIVPERSMKIMLHLWVDSTSGVGGGDPALNVYPVTSQIDWIRFYRWDRDPRYPCTPTPACLDATDKEFGANNAKESAPP
jgi:endo-1,3-1,4-beta-glycanase ExoK